MPYAYRVKPGESIHLADHDPNDKGGVKRDEADKEVVKLNKRLGALQEWLYAADRNSVLIVLQGIDTAGKDGTVSHVMAQLNPTGCRVESFKVPTPEEAGHDFLWRIHKVTPMNGSIAIFNRSHYEDVLVARVHDLVPKEVWERRYDEINHFETLLADAGTIVLKFFLHISKDEQTERLKAREKDPSKAWKLSDSDWPEHERYDEYTKAYEDALTHCSTMHAPWYIIAANHKWYRNLAVADIVVATLEERASAWRKDVVERGKKNLAAIEVAARPAS